MKTRWLSVWESVRTSYWFVPSLMTLAGIALSFVTISIDHNIEYKWVQAVGWLWAGGVDGAREMLSTIAGSVITVASVTFSITITALTLASQQFGPRLLRNFMRDTGNQVVLGTFIATFIYCLLVLRTVRSVEEDRFVPYLSVSCGMALAICSIGVLIYFIHHVADSIQIENLIANVGEDLQKSIEKLFPERIAEPLENTAPTAQLYDDGTSTLPADFEKHAGEVSSRIDGYVQGIGNDRVLNLAVEQDLLLRLHHRPGDFVAQGMVLAQVWPPSRATDEVKDSLCNAFVIGRRRTPFQDVEYAVRQLAEIAVRALSPGINDPFTAMSCIDWLGAAMGQLAQRKMPSPLRSDDQGQLRVIAPCSTFVHVADTAFHPIRHYGSSSPQVVLHLLAVLASLAPLLHREADRESLRYHAGLIASDGRYAIANADAQREITEKYQAALRALARTETETEQEKP